MNVQEKVYAVLFHLLLHEKYLRTDFRTGVLPRAVEILTHGVGTQMAVESTVRVHVRHQIQIGLGKQSVQLRVVQLLQAFDHRSEEHTSELQSLMRIPYDVFCMKTKISMH